MKENRSVPVRRVLIVDDERDIADIQALLLRLCGQNVQHTYDGPSALEIAAEFKPEVVFLDLVMPGMNGFALAERLRQVDGLEKTRLVAVSGLGQPAFREAARSVGFDDYIQKPATADDFINALAKVRA